MEKAKGVRMLILDVDGVMTDGSLPYNDAGAEGKVFHVHDGLGIVLLMRENIKVAIISGRKSKAVEFRAQELGITEIHQAVKDKLATFEEIIKRDTISKDEVAFMGDDLVDLPLLSRVGFAVSVPDAPEEIKERVDYVTKRDGGKGAVREVCELILKAQGKWEKWCLPT